MSATSPDWWFYHLEQTSLEAAAAPLLMKCLERGWRVLAVSPSPARRAALDRTLWTFDDESFLPHGDVDAPGLDPSRQPVLLTAKPENANNAQAVMLMDGAEIPVASPFERCMVMFDGADSETRNRARVQFKAARDAGLTTRYFQQTPRGGWKEAGQ